MVEIHRPHMEDDDVEDAATPPPSRTRHVRPVLKLALEVVLIGVGVFLGLAGEQWRESAHRRHLATESLRRFRAEIQLNRESVANVKEYHLVTKKSIEAYLSADPKARQASTARLRGIQPVFFEHTAWDLAIATQSLSDIDPGLAFAVSRVYGTQQEYAELSRGMLQAMYLNPPGENVDSFFRAVDVYYGDIVLLEPKLLELYDGLLPQIDRALGDSREPSK